MLNENPQAKTEANIRRELHRMAEVLKPVENTAGWRMSARPLRESLLKMAVAYPDVSQEEFTELMNAINEVLPALMPQDSQPEHRG